MRFSTVITKEAWKELSNLALDIEAKKLLSKAREQRTHREKTPAKQHSLLSEHPDTQKAIFYR